MQPLPFNGFVVEEEEDEDDVMSDDLLCGTHMHLVSAEI
jgi:hypothetical protein